MKPQPVSFLSQKIWKQNRQFHAVSRETVLLANFTPKRPFFLCPVSLKIVFYFWFQTSFSETGLKPKTVSFEFWKIACTPVKTQFLSWNRCIQFLNYDMNFPKIFWSHMKNQKLPKILKLKLKKSSFLKFWNSILSFFARSQITPCNPVFFVAQKRMVSPLVQNPCLPKMSKRTVSYKVPPFSTPNCVLITMLRYTLILSVFFHLKSGVGTF